jgi:N-methylhydantoinase A
MDARTRQFRLSADIGGTFTDIVLLGSDGRLHSRKVLSTPGDYSEAIEGGVTALLDEVGVRADQVREFAHGTTVATNAIIERKGVKVGLITTAGFRDVLEIGRFRSPRLYDLGFRKPEPLVERRLRLEVRERVMADGSVLRALDLSDMERAIEKLREQKVDAVAVCFLNSYVNGANEAAAVELLAERLPGVSICASTQLIPQINEYERTSTTVVNAYIRPIVDRYVRSLDDRLRRMEIDVPLMIMQSSGGLLPSKLVAENPVYVIESGPAGGVVGAQRLCQRAELGDLIVFDMGGTTAKASLLQKQAYSICSETEVGGGAALGHRLIQGAGFIVQVPTIDIAEVGAGGGSIASIDVAGGIRVGPESAGADPGPACYARGGTAATVTDANLLLGYLNPNSLCGGELPIDYERAERAVAAVAAKAGIPTTEAAYGIHLIANSNMMRALHGVSTERGRDPSQFGLLAIGGNGGVHAASLAETLRISRIVVPPVAGLFSALGLLFADVEHHLVAGFYRRLSGLDPEVLNRVARPLFEEASKLLASEGFPPERQKLVLHADLKYIGQMAALTVPFKSFPVSSAALEAIGRDMSDAHLESYGYRSDGEPVQFVALKVIGQGLSETSRVPAHIERDRESSTPKPSRKAYFGPEWQWLETAVTSRAALGPSPVTGPLIVEEYDTTTVVRPKWTARRDGWNNVVIERAGQQ